jgi:hypothetical protein
MFIGMSVAPRASAGGLSKADRGDVTLFAPAG